MKKNSTSLFGLLNYFVGIFFLIIVTSANAGNIMVVSDDSDRDTIERGNRIYNAVIGELKNYMVMSRKFKVYKEEGITGRGRGNFKQGRSRRPVSELIDIARRVDSVPINYLLIFKIYFDYEPIGYTTIGNFGISGELIDTQSGEFLGKIDVTDEVELSAKCGERGDRKCLLREASDKVKPLSMKLGNSVKSHLEKVTSGSRKVHDYSLKFVRYSTSQVMRMEEYLVKTFSGYKSIQPVNCMPQNCKYFYQSSIDSAHLNRNLKKMLMEMGLNPDAVDMKNDFEFIIENDLLGIEDEPNHSDRW